MGRKLTLSGAPQPRSSLVQFLGLILQAGALFAMGLMILGALRGGHDEGLPDALHESVHAVLDQIPNDPHGGHHMVAPAAHSHTAARATDAVSEFARDTLPPPSAPAPPASTRPTPTSHFESMQSPAGVPVVDYMRQQQRATAARKEAAALRGELEATTTALDKANSFATAKAREAAQAKAKKGVPVNKAKLKRWLAGAKALRKQLNAERKAKKRLLGIVHQLKHRLQGGLAGSSLGRRIGDGIGRAALGKSRHGGEIVNAVGTHRGSRGASKSGRSNREARRARAEKRVEVHRQATRPHRHYAVVARRASQRKHRTQQQQQQQQQQQRKITVDTLPVARSATPPVTAATEGKEAHPYNAAKMTAGRPGGVPDFKISSHAPSSIRAHKATALHPLARQEATIAMHGVLNKARTIAYPQHRRRPSLPDVSAEADEE